jgi:hypothetical protein
MAGASKPVDVSTKQQRIAKLAQQSPEMGFTSLAYFIDLDWLVEAFHRTRKDGSVGAPGRATALGDPAHFSPDTECHEVKRPRPYLLGAAGVRAARPSAQSSTDNSLVAS